jgi:hypothetical protein
MFENFNFGGGGTFRRNVIWCYMKFGKFEFVRNHPSLGIGEALDLGIGAGLGLVAEYDVRVREDGHHLVLEELDEEGGGQVHAVRLVLLSTLLARLKQSLGLLQDSHYSVIRM